MKNVRIDLVEYDRHTADQLLIYAVMQQGMAKLGQITAEEAAGIEARCKALAEKIGTDPPHAGQWVSIRPFMRYGDACDAESAATRFTEDGRRYTDTAQYRLEVLRRQIAAWSLLDEDGEPIELGGPAIRDLDEDLGGWIFDRIDAQRVASRRTVEQMDALKSGAAGGDEPA